MSARLLDYSMTKGGIHAFTRSLATHLVPRGIRVNAVAPAPNALYLQRLCAYRTGSLEGPRRERKVSMLHLIGKQFEIVRDAVEFPIVMRNLHFFEDRVHVAVVLKPRILISDEHRNRNGAPDFRGIGAGQGPGVLRPEDFRITVEHFDVARSAASDVPSGRRNPPAKATMELNRSGYLSPSLIQPNPPIDIPWIDRPSREAMVR